MSTLAEVRAVTNPTITENLVATGSAATSITINWDTNESATGYIIYRREGSGNFVTVTSTKKTTYTDQNLKSGTSYRYKIRAYADTKTHKSVYSSVVKTSTTPAQIVLKGKPGNGKLRLSWPAVTGASGYHIYQYIDGQYNHIGTLVGKSSTSIVYENMTIGDSYTYTVCAYRNAFDQTFTGETSIAQTVTPVEAKPTTTVPSYYRTKKALVNSAAWQVDIIKTSAVYNKCLVIPGIRSTNVAGFESTNMVPQAITFMGNYLLISAYDADKEENSVIYVMNKNTRKLLTVIVLPNKTHAGGMCYDGTYVWVTNGKKICAVSARQIKQAAKAKDVYREVSWIQSCETGNTASFLTYYKNQIWAGNYHQSSPGTLKSFSLSVSTPTSASTTGAITLKEKSSVTIPAAVQGLTFTSNGRLILSRAYGYTNELNIYKPTKTGSANMKLGKILKKITTPALNEGIAISGNYLYVNFESGIVGSQALNHMDRIVALKLKDVLKLK